MSLLVLVVDESNPMRRFVSRFLNALGINCAEASDGPDALALCEQHRFDLVITDLTLPSRTGLALLQSIRATGSKVPVVVMTTSAEPQRREEALAAGVSDYLLKPFTDETRARLRKICEGLAKRPPD